MARITKRQEAQQDLKRYKRKLGTEDNFEDREFHICGIKNLMNWSMGWWRKLEYIEDNYSITKISSVGCVPRDRVENVLKNPFKHKEEAKKIYVGFEYGTST